MGSVPSRPKSAATTWVRFTLSLANMIDDSAFGGRSRMMPGARRLKRHWRQLCTRYLPARPGDSIWRYRYGVNRRLPESGWKLHVSATILNAPSLLKRIAPFLIDCRVQFKARPHVEQTSQG